MANDNNEYLSQEEIDALLNQSGDASDDASGDSSDGTSVSGGRKVEDYLTPIEQDALGEIGNITFGSAATALSTLLGKKVDITTPKVSVIARNELEKEFPKPHVAVHVKYVEGFQGINLLVVKTEDAKVIADLMLGGDGTNVSGELNDIHISAAQEAMNQMMGSAATSMSTIFNRMVNISPPGIDIMDVANDQGVSNLPEEEVLVSISFRLKIEDLIDSSIMQLLTVSFSKEMIKGLMGESAGEDAQQKSVEKAAENDKQAGDALSEEELSALTEQLSASSQNDQPAGNSSQPQQQVPPQQPNPGQVPQQPMQPPGGSYGGVHSGRNVNVQPVEYTQFSQDHPAASGDVNLNLLMDIPLKVTVELGRTKKPIKEILEFTQGSIIELDKLAGEPVDILVNDKLIARGEVVVIDENFGVRVTDIVSQMDRLHKLQ